MGTNYHSLFDLERGFVVSLEVMKKILSLAFLSCILLIAPMMTLARGLVPCGGPGEEPCQTCHVVSLTQNVIGWLVAILGVIAAIVIVYAGIKLVTSGGNQSAMESAKSMISNVIIGYIIVLAGWLLIDFGMKSLVDQGDFGVWNVIECVVQPVPDEYTEYVEVTTVGGGVRVFGTTTPGTPTGDGTCAVIPSGPCSPGSLSAFGSLASQASQICNAESGGNTQSESRSDRITDGRAFSFGLFQINLTVHELQGCGGPTLRCLDAFSGSNYTAVVTNEALYAQCAAAAKTAACNITNAVRIYNERGSWGAWSTASVCNL